MREQHNIHDLLGKYFSGEASPEEAMFVEDWKNSSEESRLHFIQCEKIFSTPAQPDTQKAWAAVKPQLTSGKIVPIRPLASYMSMAAAVALLIGLGAAMMLWLDKSGENTLEYIASAESKHVVLSDGTDITLSPNSSLTEEEGFGKKERRLHLKGSAYFSVVHDEEVPFVVDAGGVFIKDIGTRFFIETTKDTDTVHVRVDEGVVLLFDDKNANVEIKAGGNALYVKSTQQLITPDAKTPQPAPISFANNTLEEVVKKLNEVYKTNIQVANPALNRCTITTQFSNEKLETILSVIAETLGLTYEKTDKGYILKGTECQQ